MIVFAPTASSAREALAAGELAEWSQAFLRGEGDNVNIANPLSERGDDVYLLAEVRLDDVNDISGVGDDFDWPVPRDEFEAKVTSMMQRLEEGWDAPPLIVHAPTLRLVDGNHRREALLRLGRSSYWAVMWFRRPPPNGRGQAVSLDA
jgi:hypothetical protein